MKPARARLREMKPRRWQTLVIALTIAGVVTVSVLEIILASFPLLSSLQSSDQTTPATPIWRDQNGRVLAIEATDQARVAIPARIDDLGPWLPEITVLLEDHRFPHHQGIDLYAIGASSWSALKHREFLRGGSTLSQQTIKLARGSHQRGWRHKGIEALGALKLERTHSKEAILQRYLNHLDYGNRRQGPESAAQAYFGKSCGALTLGEAIYLAGLPQAPSRFNPWRHPQRAMAKFNRSVNRLTELDYLTNEQSQALLASPPRPGQYIPPNTYSHFIGAARRFHPDRPSDVTLTLNPQIQDKAQAILTNHLQALQRHDIRNGAVVVIENHSGFVRALINASTAAAMEESHVNAALVPRHAGSTLKPFVYAQGIEERRLTAATVFPDTAQAIAKIYADYDPKNFNRRYYGPIRLREALGNSLNIPAILASHEIGPRRAFEHLSRWGIEPNGTFDDHGAGFVLGNMQVTLLDLTNAYATLARGGITAAHPAFLSNQPPAMKRSISTPACVIIQNILADNDARQASFGTRSLLHFPAHQQTAVKTGTSSNYRDAWVVGCNRDFTVGVWVGNLNGASMGKALAIETAGPVWRQVMRDLFVSHGARPLNPPTPSNQLTAIEIDSLSGLLAPADSPTTLKEWFLPGTVPDQSAEGWLRNNRPYLPEIYREWCESPHNHLEAQTASMIESEANDRKNLTILSPRPQGHYVIDRALPSDQQHLLLKTRNQKNQSLEWHIGGELIESSPPQWPLQPGNWNVRVTDTTTGAEAQTTFTVSSP